jgi:hypothetical protein
MWNFSTLHTFTVTLPRKKERLGNPLGTTRYLQGIASLPA